MCVMNLEVAAAFTPCLSAPAPARHSNTRNSPPAVQQQVVCVGGDWGVKPLASQTEPKHRRGSASPLLGMRMKKGDTDADTVEEVKTFKSFQLLEISAGSGDLTMKQAWAAARQLAEMPAKLTTLDMMAALGACFAAGRKSRNAAFL